MGCWGRASGCGIVICNKGVIEKQDPPIQHVCHWQAHKSRPADRRADVAADFMPRTNSYMHLMPDAGCRGQKRLCCVFLFFCCVRSLPQACAAAGTKAMQRAWTVVCFYSCNIFFQTSGQKQHRSNLYLQGMPMTEPGQKLEILCNFVCHRNRQHKPVGKSQPGALPALCLVRVYLFCSSVALPIA